MLRKSQVYQIALVVWAAVSALAVLLLYTGTAEPVVSPAELPGEPWVAFPLVAVLWAVGFLAVTVQKRRAWTGAGKAANLTPESGGLLSGPELTGTVRGRRVRVHTVKRSRGDRDGSPAVSISKENSKNATGSTYTVVETDLVDPIETGLVVGRGDDETAFGSGRAESQPVGDGIVALGGGSDALVEALGTRPVRDTLLAPERAGTLTIGDPAHVVLDATPDMSGSMIGGAIEEKIKNRVEEEFPGEATTVASETKGLVLDGAELRRQTEAVTAVADATEAHHDAPE